MPTVEDIIVQRYQMTLEDFIARGPQIVPAYYGRMINAINAEDSKALQEILIEDPRLIVLSAIFPSRSESEAKFTP